MNINANFKWNSNVNSIIKDTLKTEKTLLYMANTWQKLYDPFVPMDSGHLAHNSLYIEVVGDVGYIHHTAPYARRLYHSEGYKFSEEEHKLATARWDEAAKTAGKKEILAKNVENFIKKKG